MPIEFDVLIAYDPLSLNKRIVQVRARFERFFGIFLYP
jgi:hypothetical protein